MTADNNWYCPHCDYFLDGEFIRWTKEGDPICKHCNRDVQGKPDPPYDHTGHDTLEEKQL